MPKLTPARHNAQMRELAVRYAMDVLRHANDGQDGEAALIDHDLLGPWLDGEYGDDRASVVQSIIFEAEKRLGDDLPY